MAVSMFSGHRHKQKVNSAAERNKEPILQILKQYIVPPTDEVPQRLLEVSSGSGQHVAHFAPHFPWVAFQPSEFDDSLLSSIAAHVQECGQPNVKQPIYLDITQSHKMWNGGRITGRSQDYILNFNMIHITPYVCTQGLFKNAGIVLKPGGLLFTYGPYAFDGTITPDSNVNFDAMLRQENAEWGLRDVSDLAQLAQEHGLGLERTHAMPANNHILVWRKQQDETA